LAQAHSREICFLIFSQFLDLMHWFPAFAEAWDTTADENSDNSSPGQRCVSLARLVDFERRILKRLEASEHRCEVLYERCDEAASVRWALEARLRTVEQNMWGPKGSLERAMQKEHPGAADWGLVPAPIVEVCDGLQNWMAECLDDVGILAEEHLGDTKEYRTQCASPAEELLFLDLPLTDTKMSRLAWRIAGDVSNEYADKDVEKMAGRRCRGASGTVLKIPRSDSIHVLAAALAEDSEAEESTTCISSDEDDCFLRVGIETE